MPGKRYGDSKRWADVAVHRGVAHWVEVAVDMSLDARGQIAQVLVSIADLNDGPIELQRAVVEDISRDRGAVVQEHRVAGTDRAEQCDEMVWRHV